MRLRDFLDSYEKHVIAHEKTARMMLSPEKRAPPVCPAPPTTPKPTTLPFLLNAETSFPAGHPAPAAFLFDRTKQTKIVLNVKQLQKRDSI
jgi:hypothetical protein